MSSAKNVQVRLIFGLTTENIRILTKSSLRDRLDCGLNINSGSLLKIDKNNIKCLLFNYEQTAF